MTWRNNLSEQDRRRVDDWLARAMHDLVKYLEMMPRSLDWDDLDDDDLDTIRESIFETRTSRGHTRSAQDIWDDLLSDLPPDLHPHLPLDPISDAVRTLMTLAAPLDNDPPDSDQVDLDRLHGVLFDIGARLRALQRDGA